MLRHVLEFAVISILLLFLPGLSGMAVAEEACPPWATPDASRLERGWTWIRNTDGSAKKVLGPPFTEEGYYWNRGVWFRIPMGYFNPWPRFPWKHMDLKDYKELLADSKSNGFDEVTGEFNKDLIVKDGSDTNFSFWMSSRRYVERNKAYVPSFRPCEAGYPKPEEDQYVVQFRILWPFLPDSGLSPPAHVFRVQEETLQRGELLPLQKVGRIEHTLNGPISGRERYHIYSNGEDLAVSIRCTAYIDSQLPNPLCSGHVWQKSENLILHVIFPSEFGQVGSIEKWRDPVYAAIEFSKQWRQ